MAKAKSKSSSHQGQPLLDLQQSARIEFLGWDQPILHSACDYLLSKYRRGSSWDLDRMLVVLPGSLAGRRLQSLLAQRASEQRLVLRPPEILTLGKLPEKLYQAKLPFATALEQSMAWTQVLRAMPVTELQPLLFEVPASQELAPWMDLAQIIGSLHRELASDLLDFADVARRLAETAEEARWRVLEKLQRRYLDVLHEAGLWDVQSARRFALEHHEVNGINHEVVMIGTVDLNRAQRRFLAAIAPNVTALIGAPSEFLAGFDLDGTLRSEFWQDIEIPIPDEAIHVRSSIREAADELAVQLANLGSHRKPSEITVGVPDPTLIPSFQESLARVGVALRYGPGVPISSTQPMRLLRAIEEFLADGEIEAFHTLIRSTLVEQWLLNTARIQPPTMPTHPPSSQASAPNEPQRLPNDFLAAIDEYLNATLLRSVAVPMRPEYRRGKQEFIAVDDALSQWLQPLKSGKRRLTQWSIPLREILGVLYQSYPIDLSHRDGNAVFRACQEMNAVLDQLAKIPSNLDCESELSDALAWMHEQLDSVQIPPLRNDAAIEMIGWLELALDDAPVLMLSGLHDGVIPESVNADAFLPNRLRSELGLIDNARRYARDAFVMLTVLHTRERVEFVLNRLSSDGDPLTPSRLLLAVPLEKLARRVRHLISESQKPKAVVVSWTPKVGQSNIPIPLPDSTVSIRDMAVTDFKKYSECPYRFYLNRVKKLRPVRHLPLELDGGAFGDLVHKVLEDFFDSYVANSSDEKSVADWLVDALASESRTRFGALPPPAVVVQIEQAKLRMREFAKHQVAQTKAGWRMIEAEFTVDKEHAIILQIQDGREMKLHGRIDRIDEHEGEKKLAVWDYKTGDSSGDPRTIHFKGGKWADWQLPLYGLLIEKKRESDDIDEVTFGYILMPKSVSNTRFVVADFNPSELDAAVDSAKEIAGQVLDGIFWPPNSRIRPEYDDYRAITQGDVVRRWDPKIAALESQPNDRSNVSETQVSGAEDLAVPEPRVKTSMRAPRMLELHPVLAIGEAPKDWFAPAMILASAGTGKTYQLASRAIRLLFTNQPLDSVLATTFTRKAAGEILHRILDWLAEGCETEAGFSRLVEILQPLRITREAVQYQLARLCAQLHRFRVSTLDSFYSQLARSFALELELPPGWTLVDPSQADQLNREAITRMFESIEHAELRSMISQLSKGDAVRSIRAEIENVVTSGYSLFRKSAKNKDAWLRFDVPVGPEEATCRQALEIVRFKSLGSDKSDKARDKTIQLYIDQDWEEFLKQTLVVNCNEDLPMYNRKPVDSDIANAIRILSRHAVSSFLASRRAQNEAAFDLLERFDKSLIKVKKTRRLVMFEDIAERLAKWMQTTIDNAREQGSDASLKSIAHRMDCSIDHLLLDEFQDTSPDQWKIVKPFADAIVEVVQSANPTTSFFCVGDSKQAIYAWRGGESEIFESVGQQIRNVRSENLDTSRRSSPIVIDFVNDVFSRLALHPTFLSEEDLTSKSSRHAVVEAWVKKYFVPHTTARDTLPGYIEFRNSAAVSKDSGEDQETGHGLFEEVVQRVAELHAQAPQASIGILTRTNFEVGRLITMLRELGVEASQEGGNPLIDTAPVLVIMSALQLADHPGDSLAYFHVMESPMREYWVDALRSNPAQVSHAIRRSLDFEGLGATVSAMANFLAPNCNWRDQQRLQQLVEEAYRFATFRRMSIHEFLEYVSLHRVALPTESRVRVMTIHQSKGLEFDAVFLPSLDETIVARSPEYLVMRTDSISEPIGIMRHMARELQVHLDLPWQIAFKESAERQLGEALCLFYVALTRARQALYLVASPGKKPGKRWGSVLHSLFASDGRSETPGAILHTSGDSDWFKDAHGTSSEDQVPSDRADLAPKRLRISLSSQTATAHAELTPSEEWVAPSEHRESHAVDAADLWRPEETEGAVIGKLVHRWFEEIHGWIEDFVPNKKLLTTIAAASLTQQEMTQVRIPEWIDRFVGYLDTPAVRSVLSQDRYEPWNTPALLRLEVTNERRLLERVDHRMVRGTIDRCVLGFDGERVIRAEVIDFKIDQKPNLLVHDRAADSQAIEAWVVERATFHAPQLQMYGRVLCQQYGLQPDQVALTIVLLSAGRTVAIPMQNL